MANRGLRWTGVLFLAVMALGAGPGASEPFPLPDSLRGHVAFWKKVFAEWELGQVAVHDLDHPAVVYEVVDLPGKPEIPYTAEQRDFVDDLGESWEDRLEALERKVDAGEELADDEKRLALKLTTLAGTDSIRGAHERVRTQRGLRERFRRGIEISGRYMEGFRRIFREEGLPEDLAYLPHVESSFQTSARSSAGAVGIWQFTRGTGRQFLVINSALDERLDPVAATRGAAKYFRKAYDELGTWPLAVTSYNHGVHGMRRAKAQLGTDFERIVAEYKGRTFGFASRNFYAEFLAAREIARSPEQFFPNGLNPEGPLVLDRMVLEHRTSPGRISRDYGVPLDELAELNTGWTTRAVRRGYALPPGSTVWLPAGALAKAASDRSTGGYHVVERRETLSSIALRYGMTLAELRGLNGMPARESLIRVGQKLRVKPLPEGSSDPLVHVVRRGDNLSTIARRYGLSLEELRRLNGLSRRESLIRPGQELVVGPWDISTLRRTLVHIVRRGETLIRIAAAYGITLADLLVTNRLTPTSIIYPGQQIVIPLAR